MKMTSKTVRRAPFFLMMIILLLLGIAGNCTGQNRSSQRDVVSEIPFFSGEKMLPEIQKKLVDYPGIKITGYCEKRSLVFLNIDSELYPDNEHVLIVFKKMGIDIYLKPPVSKDEIITNCGNDYILVSQ